MSDEANQFVQIGISYGPWLTAGAILLSALAAAATALISISEQRKIARKRATLDLLSQKEWDSDYIKAKKHFNQLRDAPTGLEMWAEPEYKDSEQLNVIRNTLNDYELISIGIKENILDEELYKRWFKTSFLKDYKASIEFIRRIQQKEGTSSIFSEMKWLADRWT